MLKMEIKKLSPRNRRYLGSKTRMLANIHEIVKKECTGVDSFLDLFAGTGVVGESFNTKNTSVIFNDTLTSNYYSYIAWFHNQEIDSNKIKKIIEYYNEQKDFPDNYVSINFSNTYFSEFNSKKIGFIREDIELKNVSGAINFREKAILITSLLMSFDRVANTVGHYDAFRRTGELNKELIIYDLELPENSLNQNNKFFCEDSNELVKYLYADLVYIDPPYNSRQYIDAYHFLENIAEWKKPNVFGVAKKFERTEKKSNYSLRSAPRYFAELIENINAKYILISYNNTGTKGASRSQAKITDFDIIKELSKKGSVTEYKIDYRPFSTGSTDFENHQERLFLCKVGKVNKKHITLNKSKLFVKSPLNYTGGKFKLLDQLISKFPKKIDVFVDLFGGGFNVGANIKAKKIIYNDIQKPIKRLIELLYRNNPIAIIDEVENIISTYSLSDSQKNGYDFYNCNSDSGLGSYNKKSYYKMREDYNQLRESKKKDYLLLVLIIFSFNNQIRFNSNNEFNMPVGKRDFNKSVRVNLINFSNLLKDIEVVFKTQQFDALEISNNSFVYCDPPYLLGLASYNESDGWSLNHEERLLKFLKKIDESGIKFALSNLIEHKGKQNILLKEWIDENNFNTHLIKSSYRNSNYQNSNRHYLSKEILVTNY